MVSTLRDQGLAPLDRLRLRRDVHEWHVLVRVRRACRGKRARKRRGQRCGHEDWSRGRGRRRLLL